MADEPQDPNDAPHDLPTPADDWDEEARRRDGSIGDLASRFIRAGAEAVASLRRGSGVPCGSIRVECCMRTWITGRKSENAVAVLPERADALRHAGATRNPGFLPEPTDPAARSVVSVGLGSSCGVAAAPTTHP